MPTKISIKHIYDKEALNHEISLLEQEFEQGNIDDKLIYSYQIYCNRAHEQKRFFHTIIKYKIYDNPKTRDIFFRVCCREQQRKIYDRYMPDYLPQYIQKLAKTTISYNDWYGIIILWGKIEGKGIGREIGLHFTAFISVLKKQQRHLFDDMLMHPIYQKMIKIYDAFIKKPDMDYIDQLDDMAYKHAINVRKMNNFNSDPWVQFYHDLKYSNEYIAFMKPYHQYMDMNNIDYQDKLIFFLEADKNIGDNFNTVNMIINWSLKHQIPLIAILTSFQAQWIRLYYKDYFDYVIIRDSDVNFPYVLKAIFPQKNCAISLGYYKFNRPPYYCPISNLDHHTLSSKKIYFNYYTCNHLYGKNADVGNIVKICNISKKIKQQNLMLFQQHKIDPKKIILLEPKSFWINGICNSNYVFLNFWKELIIKLRNNDFYPIINTASADEKQYIDNVTHLHLPLTHIIDFVDNIGGFIAIRTGLCDLLISSNNDKKYCVYPIEYIGNIYDMSPWFNIVNLKMDTVEQHIDDIINSLKGHKVEALEKPEISFSFSIPDYCPDEKHIKI